MSDHNFEKQIQQKLDELKIPPADAVWQSVQERIKKDKRRRRGLILFPMLLLLLSTASYFIFLDNNPDKSSTAKLSQSDSTSQHNNLVTQDYKRSDRSDDQNDKLVGVTQTKDSQEQLKKMKTSVNSETKKFRGSNDKDVPRKKEVNLSRNKTNVVYQDGSILKTRDRSQKNVKKRANAIEPKKEHMVERGLVSQSTTNKDESTIIAGNKKDAESIASDKQISPLDDSLASNKTVAGNTVKEPVTDSLNELSKKAPPDSAKSDIAIAQNKDSAGSKKMKLKWGIHISAGISNISEGGFFSGGFLPGVFAEEKVLVADVADRNFSSAPSNVPTPVVYKSSGIEKGFSFSAGTFVQKNLSQRFLMSAGLQYSYYSNNIQVGNRIDSSRLLQNASGSLNVSQFFLSTPVNTTHKYTNQYHFIDLPLTVHIQLNRGERVPILWNGGMSLSYLISTNALHFDSRTGVYYQDNSLFNKLQANLTTGFSISVFNSSRIPIQFGPQVQYGLTNLLKKQVSESRHLLYFGLNTRFLLKK